MIVICQASTPPAAGPAGLGTNIGMFIYTTKTIVFDVVLLTDARYIVMFCPVSARWRKVGSAPASYIPFPCPRLTEVMGGGKKRFPWSRSIVS